jgi:hypothetical protein
VVHGAADGDGADAEIDAIAQMLTARAAAPSRSSTYGWTARGVGGGDQQHDDGGGADEAGTAGWSYSRLGDPEPMPVLGELHPEATLPDWLRARHDFRRVERESERMGGAFSARDAPVAHSMDSDASVGGGAALGSSRHDATSATPGADGGIGQVLVRRALETPGAARGNKDIAVLMAWAKGLDQFSHLGPLQLGVVARSLVMEHLPPGQKTAPTSESVYLVLHGA